MRFVLSIFVVCFAVQVINAYYYGFSFGSIQEPRMWFGLYVNVSIGTPPQAARVRLLSTNGGRPYIAGGKDCTEGSYDVNKSTTYVQEINSGTTEYSYGSDTLSFASGYTHKNISLTVKNDICWNSVTEIGLSYYTCDGSFICQYLRTQKYPVAVLSFKQLGNTVNTPTFGTLVMAEIPKDLCKNDWTYYNVIEIDEQFQLPVDNVKIGNFSYQHPFLKVSIVFESYDIVVIEPLYSEIVQTLGIIDDHIDYKIDCSVSTPIELQIAGENLTVSSDVYMDKTTRDTNGKCQARIVKGKRNFELPITVLTGKCLLYDYGTNPRIGISTSLNKP